MRYDSSANTLKNSTNDANNTIQKLKGISFESFAVGSSYEALTSNFKAKVSELEMRVKSVDDYAATLKLVQKYKEGQQELADLRGQLANIPDNKENISIIESISAKINELIEKLSKLKMNILTKLANIFPQIRGLKIFNVNYNNKNDRFIVDTGELYNTFSENTLRKLSDSDSLFNYYNREDVVIKLNQICNTYSGRYAAVNSALCIMDIASDLGLKLDYEWGGGHGSITSIDAVASGSDCSGFVSWAINQGSTNEFSPLTTAGLLRVGNQIEYSSAKEGDILVYNDGKSGHVLMIVDNEVETGKFLVAEAAGSNMGVIMSIKTYNQLYSYNYQARDLTEIYGN